MDAPYYSDEMTKFVQSMGNPFSIEVMITQSDDEDGPYLCVVFDRDEIVNRDSDYENIARYLVDLRNGLIDLGARVTFVITSAEGDES